MIIFNLKYEYNIIFKCLSLNIYSLIILYFNIINWSNCYRFLRYQKEYNPPEDVCDRINKICETQQISTVDETKIEDPLQRFNLFLACEEELQHPITNAVLCYIETIGKFYRKF